MLLKLPIYARKIKLFSLSRQSPPHDAIKPDDSILSLAAAGILRVKPANIKIASADTCRYRKCYSRYLRYQDMADIQMIVQKGEVHPVTIP
jgi:hypothetical protein